MTSEGRRLEERLDALRDEVAKERIRFERMELQREIRARRASPLEAPTWPDAPTEET